MKAIILVLLLVSCAVYTSAKPYTSASSYLEITGFADDSVLQKAGADVGDVILKYDSVVITNLEELKTARDKTDKDVVAVVLNRNGEEINLIVPKGKLGVMLKEYLQDHEVLPDAKTIEGYGRLDWNNGMSNTFLACVAIMELNIGAKTEYRDLVGFSGYGFRVQVGKDMCPSSPDACSGRNIGLSILETLGYASNPLSLLSKDSRTDQADAKQIPLLRTMIKKSIDTGYPVIAIDMIEIPEWGLITGYQKDCTQYWCRTFFDQTKGYEIAQKEPWEAYAITSYKAADLQLAYSKSLNTALEMYQTKEYNGYYSGFEAYRYWIKQLSDEKTFKKMPKDTFENARHGNWWTFMSLSEARQYCAAYLTANQNRFGVEEAKIEALAGVYKEEADLLQQHLAEIPSKFDNPPRGWTQKDRNNQIEVLKSMQDLEERAFNILKSMYSE
jgi:hypothetical protein